MKKKYLIGMLMLAFWLSLIFTQYISLFTLTTNLQKIFVFFYFLLCLLLLGFVFFRKINIWSIKIFLLSVLFGVLFTLSYSDEWKDIYCKVDVTLEPHFQEGESKDSIWISNIYIDGKDISLGQFELSTGWLYHEEWNDIISDSNTPEPLKLSFQRAKSIVIRFVYNDSFSSHITLYDGNIVKNGISLQPDGNGYLYQVEGNRLNTNLFLNFLKCFSVFTVISYIFIGSCKTTSKIKILFPVILFFLFSSYHKLSLSFALKILFLLLSIFAGFSEENISKSLIMQKYYTKKNIICIFIVALYAAFACFGHDLFLSSSLVSASLSDISIFICSSIWWGLIILMFLYILESIKLSNYSKKMQASKRSKKSIWIIAVTILSGVWILALFAYWPGNMTSDSVDQWLQATGIKQINAAHPPLYTLMIKICSSLIPHPAFFVLIQIMFFSLLIGYLFSLLYQIANKKNIIIFGAIFALLPCNYMIITTMWKDIPFTMCLVILTLLLTKIAKEPEKFWHNKINLLLLVISLIGAKELRYNGVIVFVLSILYMCYFAMKHRKFLVRILITLLFTLMLISFIHKPVYNFFNVRTENESKPYITMFAALGSAINKGGTFSENTEEILYKIMPPEDWIKWYNPFNIDSYRHNPELKGGMNVNQVSLSQAFSCYLEGLFKYPGIIIKDRLDGSNIVWGVIQPQNSFNHRYAEGIWLPANISADMLDIPLKWDTPEVYHSQNFLTTMFDLLRTQVEKYQITDIFIFRSGIYLIIYMILLLYNWINKRKWFLAASIPLLGNTLSLMLLLAHQSYRYVWYVFLCVITLIILTLTDFTEIAKLKSEGE